jgi:hypothetical protein
MRVGLAPLMRPRRGAEGGADSLPAGPFLGARFLPELSRRLLLFGCRHERGRSNTTADPHWTEPRDLADSEAVPKPGGPVPRGRLSRAPKLQRRRVGPEATPLGQPPRERVVGQPPRERVVGQRPNPRKPRLVPDINGNELKDLFQMFPDLPRPWRPAPRLRRGEIRAARK